MRKFAMAALIGWLFTMFGGSIYYSFAVFDALANGKDIVSVFLNTLGGCLILWAVITYLAYQWQTMLEELNKSQRQEYEERMRLEQLNELNRREGTDQGSQSDAVDQHSNNGK